MPTNPLATTLGLVLANNVKRLMEESGKTLDTQPKVAAAGGVDQSTISRMVNASNATLLTSLEAAARAFGIPAWQLLLPNLDTKNPPIVLTGREKKFYTQFRDMSNEFRETGEDDPTETGASNDGLPDSPSKSIKRGSARSSKTQTTADKKARATGRGGKKTMTKQVNK